VLSQSPPHTTPTEEATIEDVSKPSPQNIKTLIAKDLKKILDQLGEQAKSCENIVMVSVEECQKVASDIKVQSPIQIIDDTSTKIETQVQDGQTDQSKEDVKDIDREEEQ
jgi:hypothetical protein